jgi:hypothetical protein
MEKPCRVTQLLHVLCFEPGEKKKKVKVEVSARTICANVILRDFI